jgi:hypothetical protein
MAHIWKAQILGVGLMTPALTGLPHAATARSAGIDAPITTENVGRALHGPSIGLFHEAVFALTPAEKLKIGRGRIRLAQKTTTSEPKASPDVHAKTTKKAPSSRSCHCSNYSGKCCAPGQTKTQ